MLWNQFNASWSQLYITTLITVKPIYKQTYVLLISLTCLQNCVVIMYKLTLMVKVKLFLCFHSLRMNFHSSQSSWFFGVTWQAFIAGLLGWFTSIRTRFCQIIALINFFSWTLFVWFPWCWSGWKVFVNRIEIASRFLVTIFIKRVF